VGDLLQILRKTSVTVTQTFYSGPTATDIDSGLPTLAITRPDGTGYTPLPTVSGSWTGRTTGQYRFVLPRQLECFWLDYELTGNVGGEPQTLGGRVEWLGATLFDIGELRALRVGDEYPFATTATPLFTDQQIHDARTATLDEFEHFLGYSPVPRFAREVLDGNRATTLWLRHQKAHRVLSVTVGGVAQTAANYQINADNELEAISAYGYGTVFTWGRRNVAVEYVHGAERVMGDGGLAAMLRVTQRLLPGFSSAARTVTTPDGVTYDLGDMAGQVTRGGTTRRFGIPFIDAWLSEWSQSGVAAA
jgi:hypothetical protein